MWIFLTFRLKWTLYFSVACLFTVCYINYRASLHSRWPITETYFRKMTWHIIFERLFLIIISSLPPCSNAFVACLPTVEIICYYLLILFSLLCPKRYLLRDWGTPISLEFVNLIPVFALGFTNTVVGLNRFRNFCF